MADAQAYEADARAMIYHVGDNLPKKRRNNGYSLGLAYPYIYGRDGDRWLIWHRVTGAVVYAIYDTIVGEHLAMQRAHELNGLSQYPDVATISAIDSTP